MVAVHGLLEVLLNPNWLKYFVVLVWGLVVLFLAWFRWRPATPRLSVSSDRVAVDGARMAWLRGSANFYLLFALFALVFPKAFYIGSTELRILMNLLVAGAILVGAIQFVRAAVLWQRLRAG